MTSNSKSFSHIADLVAGILGLKPFFFLIELNALFIVSLKIQ